MKTLITKLKRKKWVVALCIATAVILVIAFSLSLFFVVTMSHHNCPGEHCPICEELRFATNFLHILKLSALLAVIIVAWEQLIKRLIIRKNEYYEASPSPIKLKVKIVD